MPNLRCCCLCIVTATFPRAGIADHKPGLLGGQWRSQQQPVKGAQANAIMAARGIWILPRVHWAGYPMPTKKSSEPHACHAHLPGLRACLHALFSHSHLAFQSLCAHLAPSCVLACLAQLTHHFHALHFSLSLNPSCTIFGPILHFTIPCHVHHVCPFHTHARFLGDSQCTIGAHKMPLAAAAAVAAAVSSGGCSQQWRWQPQQQQQWHQ